MASKPLKRSVTTASSSGDGSKAKRIRGRVIQSPDAKNVESNLFVSDDDEEDVARDGGINNSLSASARGSNNYSSGGFGSRGGVISSSGG